MKKRLSCLRIVISMCAALGWWGMLYPELTLTPDTIKISVEDESGSLKALPPEWDSSGSLYLELLRAGEEKITFRSKLLTSLSSLWEILHEGNENQ